jgi:two-component system NtrC family sensor kinase
METRKHDISRTKPTPGPESGVPGAAEARIYRALLAGGGLDRVMPGVLGVLAASVGLEWGAIAAAESAGEGRVSHAWLAHEEGGFGIDEELVGLDIAGACLTGTLRDEALPLPWAEELSAALAGRGLARLLCAPLGGPGRAGAALLLARRAETAFSRTERALVEAISGPLGTILESSSREKNLERRVEERLRELSVLYDVSRAAGTTLRYEDLTALLARSLHSVLEIDLAAILVEMPGHTGISLHLSRPASPECRIEAARLARESFRAFSGRESIARDIRICPMEEFEPAAALITGRLRSQAAAPLVRRGEIVGALCVFNRMENAFPERHVRLFHTLANQASLTLDRLRTHQEDEESRLQSILHSMSSGVLTTDREFRIVFANPAARRTLKDLTGSETPAVVDRLGDIDLAHLARPVLDGTQRSVETEILTEDPRRIHSLSLSRVSDAGGAQSGIVILISDVTHARMMQEQFQQTEKLSALGEMISGVAHELNNPLASVMGYAQILQRARVRPEVLKKLQIIQAESQRCQRIVQNLLGFARKHRPGKQPLDLNAVLNSVLGLVSYQLRVDGIEVVTALDPGVPAVHGDFHQLQQVFLNIVNNAHQAIHAAGSPGRIEVASMLDADRVRIEIRDTGPGISPDNLKRIFDPFFTTKAVGEGTGLGLSLAYGTVRDHNGTIFARSQVGKGTTLVVEIPLAAAPAAEEAPRVPVHSARPAPGGAILVVEDEKELARLLCEALTAGGHRAEAVFDGDMALRRIRENSYDVVISDIKMPRVDGRRLFEEAGRIRPGLERRFIFSTGDTASPTTAAFLESSGAGVIPKPFDLDEVMRAVAAVLDREGV